MRNKCNIIRDLLPLYVEDMVSADSASFVNEHLSECPSCRAEYHRMKKSTLLEDTIVHSVDRDVQKRSFQSAKRKLTLHAQLASFGVMLIALIIGLSLTSGLEMFLNALIMPIVGVLGYVVFRWKALYKTPALLTVSYVVINFILFLRESYKGDVYHMEFSGLALYTLIYTVFICIGVLIAGLLHFAFKKEDK